MREFKLDMYRHFELEDNSLFFDYYPVANSKQGLFGLTIRREHAKMMIDLEKVCNRLKKIKNATDPKLKKLEADINRLITTIQEHEAKEEKVLAALTKTKGKDIRGAVR